MFNGCSQFIKANKLFRNKLNQIKDGHPVVLHILDTPSGSGDDIVKHYSYMMGYSGFSWETTKSRRWDNLHLDAMLDTADFIQRGFFNVKAYDDIL